MKNGSGLFPRAQRGEREDQMTAVTGKNDKLKNLLLLHVLIFVFSIASVCNKKAASYDVGSFPFFGFYAVAMTIESVFVYYWQQILKKMPLITAYTNRAVSIVWGMLWGMLLFHEQIKLYMILGFLIILVGVYLIVKADG